MANPPVPLLDYKYESKLEWDKAEMKGELVTLGGDPSEVVLAGKCPKCEHQTEFAWPLQAFRDVPAVPDLGTSGGAPADKDQVAEPAGERFIERFRASKSIDVRVECRCNGGRPDANDKET